MLPTPRPSSIRGLTAARLSISTRIASPNIIHLIGTNALIFAPLSKLVSAGAIIIRHVFTSYDRTDLAVRPIRWLANTLFIDSYAFTTSRIGQWAEERSARTRRFLIRPPINCNLYRPANHRKHEDRGKRTVLYMGPLWTSRFPAISVLRGLRLLINKGIDTHLVILTSALRTSETELDRVATIGKSLGLGDNVTVRRVDLSEEERVAAYNDADVIIFPYMGPIPERLADPPFGILESMACGRMVLATDVLSISEIVEDGETGFVARECTPEEISSGLYRALTTSNRNKIETNARQRILNDFSYPKVSERLISTYSSMLE